MPAVVLAADGSPRHHVILLPGEADDITWPDAIKWANSIGGE